MSQQEKDIASEVYRKFQGSITRDLATKGHEGSSNEDLLEYLDGAVDEMLNEWDREAINSDGQVLDHETREEVLDRFKQTLGYGKLDSLLNIPGAENVYIFGAQHVAVSFGDGRREILRSTVDSDEELVELVRFLATTKGRTSRRFDYSSPILDLRLPSGHRMFAVTGVSSAPYVVIRYHQLLGIQLEDLLERATINEPIKELLYHAIIPPSPANMLVAGGTSTGKTTTLRALLSQVPEDQIVITIEDTLEIYLREQHKLCFELETRTANVEGVGEISMYDLTKAALRMAPDRVVVGEVRGGEVMQLLTAMGQGNDGSMGTIHANSSEAVITRILTYAQRSPDAPSSEFVMRYIGQSLNMILFLKVLPGQRRVIASIREVLGFKNGQVHTSEIFTIDPAGNFVYLRPPHPEGDTLARLTASGFDMAVLGEPKDNSGNFLSLEGMRDSI